MSQVAKYRQVESFIKDRIINGTYPVGTRIMTEEELVDHFGFSRMTINKALNNLSNDGFIERKPGKGTYVCATRVSKPTDSARSFTEDMKAIGLVAGSKLISYEVIRAHDKPEIAQRLKLSDDELLHYFIRLRTGNGKPIAISYNYVSAKILPAIDVKCLEQSFYAFLDSQGIKREYQGTSYTAKLPTAEQQELLRQTTSPCFAPRTAPLPDARENLCRLDTHSLAITAISIPIIRAFRSSLSLIAQGNQSDLSNRLL